jgi:hypothetical protein
VCCLPTGTLHLGILIENMRREGYEFEIGPPSVITKEIGGVKMEPFEDVRLRGCCCCAVAVLCCCAALLRAALLLLLLCMEPFEALEALRGCRLLCSW